MYTTQSDAACVTAVTRMLLQLLIISLNIAELFTRLFPCASYLQVFVDSSAIDSGVTLGASNQPRQPRPQSTMHAQTRAFSLHLCKLAEAMSLIPSDATSPRGCSVSYSCSAPREPEQTWCSAVIATVADLVLVRIGFFSSALNPDHRATFCIIEIELAVRSDFGHECFVLWSLPFLSFFVLH